MLSLFTILDNLPKGGTGLEIFEGPLWVGAASVGLYALRKAVDMISDSLSARRIRRDEERLKREAAHQNTPIVPFIPESIEARIFRLEKDKLEDDLKELRLKNEELRFENVRLHEKVNELQDTVLLEQRANADLRIDLRYERERRDSERAKRVTEPLRRSTLRGEND